MSRTAQQIATDRARYEEHQRRGLQFAPKALPGPSPLPAPPIPSDRVIHTETIPGGWYFATNLKRGEAIRIAQPHGASSVALIAWNADDPSERLNLPDTVKVQWTTAIAKGRVIFSDMGRVMFSVIEDSSGAHDGLVGGSTAASNAARYPGITTRNTRDNFILAAAKLGLVRAAIPLPVTFFAPVETDADGKFIWNEAKRAQNDFVDLRAEQDLLIVISNCPHPLDPAPDYAPGALEMIRYRLPDTVDDFCRTGSAESIRAFHNTKAAARA